MQLDTTPKSKFDTELTTGHRRFFITVVLTAFFLLGGAVGYSMGLVDSTNEVGAFEVSTSASELRELKEVAQTHYVNPFELVDAKGVDFPVEQVGACRNWSECHAFCANPTNFATCVAWSRTQGFIE